MSENENQFKPNASSKNSHGKREKGRQKSSLTLSQIKLSVALELKAEGYENVLFDEVIEFKGRRAKAHVFCKDEDGFCLAVYCINRAELMKAERVFEVVNVMSRRGYDVAIAFPLTLLDKATVVIGMTHRVFMVDQDCRVWVHYPLMGSRIMEVFREAKEAILEREEDEEISTTEDRGTQLCVLSPFYVA